MRNYNSSSPIVTGNDIQYNQYYGFYCSYYSNPVLNYSSSQDFGGYNNISLNGTYGIQVANNAAPVIGLPNPNYGGFNSIFSNSSYEIRNSTTSTVFASNNWWGNPNGPSSGELYGSVYWNPPLSESPGGGIESLVFTSEKDSDVPRDLINAYIEKCNINYEESAELFNKYFSENPNSQFTSFAVEEYIEVLLSSGMTIEDILTEIQSISEQNICDSINYQLSLSQILLNIRIVDFDSALKLLDIMLEETKNKDRLNWLLIQKGHIYTYCLNSPESGINYFETVLSNSDEKSDVFILAYEEINNIENGSTIKLFKQKGGDVVSALCPTEYRLYNNYPNPFNPTTTIRYDIPEASHVIITIYNMNGKVVDRLVNQKQGQGFYSVQWNARNVSTGVYFYQIKTDGFQQVNKMLLIK